MVEGGLPEEATFERRPEGGEGGAAGELGQGDSLCKGPEAGLCLRNRNVGRGWELWSERELVDPVRTLLLHWARWEPGRDSER